MAGLAYRAEIDGLRAIAVVAVVLYHADASLLPGGFVGVDVFFVISGYLITALLTGEWRRTGRIDLGAFYARRIRRILPALWVVVVTVLAISALVLGPRGVPLGPIAHSAMASLAFISNIYFQANSGGYFDGPTEQQPLLHLWSLAVEEQFYLLHPLLLMIVLRRGNARAAVVIAALSLLSLALAEHWLQFSPDTAFFQMPARFWELAAGGLVALWRPASPPRWPAGIAMSGLVMVVLAVLLTDPGHFPGFGAIPAVAGSVAILAALQSTANIGVVGRLLASRPFVAIGLVSYSLYLWHWPLLAIDRAARLGPSPPSWRFGLCLLALALAWASYRYVEQPVRRMPPVDRRRLLIAAVGVTVAAGALAFFTAELRMMPAEIEALVKSTHADRPTNMHRCHFGLNAKVSALQPDSCASDPERTPTVAVWGDSHALAWQPFSWAVGRARESSATSLTMDACPPMVGFDGWRADVPGFGENCARFNALALEQLAEGGFETVIIALRWPADYPVVTRPENRGAERRGPDRRQLLTGLEAALARLHGVPEVLLLGPIPQLRHPAPRCIAVGGQRECTYSRAEFDAATAWLRPVLPELAARHPNVTLVLPGDFFCDDTTCAVTRDGYGLFWDDDHVASRAATAFAAAWLLEPARYTPVRPAAPTAAR